MTLFSRISKDDPCNYFNIKLSFPTIGKLGGYNEFSGDKYQGFECKFNTECVLIHDDTWWHFTLTIFGFGIKVMKQNGY